MKTLCVFLGASLGKNPLYFDAVVELGQEIAKKNITLIYGGGRLGLMGILADTVLKNGGSVIGVITKQLYSQEAHLSLTELIVVESMQERKRMMVGLSDGFMALPVRTSTSNKNDFLNLMSLNSANIDGFIRQI